MKRSFLLDTQVLLYATFQSARLSPNVKTLLAETEGILYFSIASLWEMQIKLSIGKLRFPVLLPEYVQHLIESFDLHCLSVEPEHVYQLASLDLKKHRDPFDRLIVAQSISEKMILVSNDPSLDSYPIQRYW